MDHLSVETETGLVIEIEASLSNNTTDGTATVTATTLSIGGNSSSSNSNNNNDAGNSDPKPKPKNKKQPMFRRYASSIARHPAKHLAVAMLLSTTVSIIVFTKGNLHLDAPSVGWFTKGTLIANRAAQEKIVREKLEGPQREKDDEKERRDEELYCSGNWYESSKVLDPHEINLVSVRKILDGNSALDADALYEMCISEEHTLNVLSENDLCHKCAVENELSWVDDGAKREERCIQPYSLVGLARLYMRSEFGFLELGTEHLVPSVSCGRLKRFWTTAVMGGDAS